MTVLHAVLLGRREDGFSVTGQTVTKPLSQ